MRLLRSSSLLLSVLTPLAFGQLQLAPQTETRTYVSPAQVARVVIPAGTQLHVRLIDPVTEYTVSMSNLVRGTLESPLGANGEIIIGSGYDVEGRIVDARRAGTFSGRGEIVLELTRLIVDNRYYDLRTSRFAIAGPSRGKRAAAAILLPAAIGAGIGAAADYGRGAAIGAGAGATAGTIGVAASGDGRQASLASETVMTFTLEQPIEVVPAAGRGPNSGRPVLRHAEVDGPRRYGPVYRPRAYGYPRAVYPYPYAIAPVYPVYGYGYPYAPYGGFGFNYVVIHGGHHRYRW